MSILNQKLHTGKALISFEANIVIYYSKSTINTISYDKFKDLTTSCSALIL